MKTRKLCGEVILATKFGNVRGEDGSFKGVDGRPDYVRQACDASLKRLGVDVIDDRMAGAAANNNSPHLCSPPDMASLTSLAR